MPISLSSSQGAKYFEWERKGVPLRLEFGARDVRAGVVTMAKRTGGVKVTVTVGNDFGHLIGKELESLQRELWDRAVSWRTQRTFRVDKYEDMKERIMSGERERLGFFLAPWKDDADNEEAIKQDCKATIRCYPADLQNPSIISNLKCFYTGEPATHIAFFARAF